MTGVLGGAFDPPHVGHVALAHAGVERFGLERLLVRVVERPGHKHVVAPAHDRLVLTRLAFAEVDAAEVSLDPHARTVDSLEQLGLADAVFLLGADELASFLEWKNPQRVLELARLGVATRPGTPSERLTAVLDELGRPDRVTVFEMPAHRVSSSAIRRLLAAGEPVDGLLSPPVVAEIARRRLYREQGEQPVPG